MLVKADFENMVKVLIIGDYAVGKSNIIFRFIDDNFNETHLTTTGYDYKEKILTLENKRTIKLQIWDTAGQERYQALNKNLFLKVQGIILIYSITERSSFENVEEWINSIKSVSEKIPILLVGNKCDLEESRVVDKQEGIELSKKMNVNFFEVSAKNNIRIEDIFTDIAETILLYAEKKRLGSISISKEGNYKKEKTASKCC